MKMQCKHLDDRAVLSLIHWSVVGFETRGGEGFYGGVGWEMERLGVHPELAYHKLDKQPGLMFGTSLMTCGWDHPKEKDGAWKKLQSLGGPLPLDEARKLITDTVKEFENEC